MEQHTLVFTEDELNSLIIMDQVRSGSVELKDYWCGDEILRDYKSAMAKMHVEAGLVM